MIAGVKTFAMKYRRTAEILVGLVLVMSIYACIRWKCGVTEICAVSSLLISVWSMLRTIMATKDAYRPVIIVDVIEKDGCYCLMVKNIGLKVACKIDLSGITPHIRREIPTLQEKKVYLVERGIRMLQTQEEKIDCFATVDTIDSISREKTFRGQVSYEDEEGVKYTSKVDIDVRNSFESLVPREKTIKDVVSSLDKIAERLSGNHRGNPFRKNVC